MFNIGSDGDSLMLFTSALKQAHNHMKLAAQQNDRSHDINAGPQGESTVLISDGTNGAQKCLSSSMDCLVVTY